MFHEAIAIFRNIVKLYNIKIIYQNTFYMMKYNFSKLYIISKKYKDI